jgi:hypothetical protein
MVRCGYKPSRDISDTEETPATKPKTTTKTKKPMTAVTRQHRHKPGPNVIREAEIENRKRFRRRPSRTLARNFYNENRLAQRAAGVDTEAPRKPRVKEPPKSEANENFQLAFDYGTPAQVAGLRKEFPEKFDKDGNLKNRKGYPKKPPAKKPTKKDVGTGEKLSGLLEYPYKHIREVYRHGDARKRVLLRKTYPEYATYFKSKEATRIPRPWSLVSTRRISTYQNHPAVFRRCTGTVPPPTEWRCTNGSHHTRGTLTPRKLQKFPQSPTRLSRNEYTDFRSTHRSTGVSRYQPKRGLRARNVSP